MKIGVLIDELASGSAPKMVGQEVKGLKSLGHDAEAVVMKKGFSSTYNFHLSGVNINYPSDRLPSFLQNINMKIPGFSFFSFMHILNAVFYPFVIKKKEWDVLVVVSSYTCLTGKTLAKIRKIPYFAWIGTEPAYYLLPRIYTKNYLKYFMPILIPISKKFDKMVIDNARAIITYSKSYHPLIQAYTDKPLEVLYPGCFSIKKFPENRENFILAYDRWDVGNTPHVLLEILPKLSREVELIVAGYWYPESIKESFLREVKRRNMESRVKILGPLDESMIIDLCSRALVHVHPNKEAFGMQSLEAAACGCPIVIPDRSGVTEIFKDGVHGYFPKDETIENYIDCVDRIISSPERAKKMGYHAWETGKEYTWEKHAERLNDIIVKYGKK